MSCVLTEEMAFVARIAGNGIVAVQVGGIVVAKLDAVHEPQPVHEADYLRYTFPNAGPGQNDERRVLGARRRARGNRQAGDEDECRASDHRVQCYDLETTASSLHFEL